MTDRTDLSDRRCIRIASCCENPVLLMTTDGVPRIGARRCRDRLCPLCNALRSGEIERRIVPMVRSAATCRFLTLTVKSTDAPLSDQLDALTAAWRRLRQRHSWTEHVRGAVGTIECTHNQLTGQWHPHLHILYDGHYWSQAEISDEWACVTRGSYIVDIRAVPDRDKAAGYIAKYASKPPKLRHLDSAHIVEWSHACHRRRMIIVCGTWASRRVAPDDGLETLTPARVVMPMTQLASHAQAGLPRPRRALDLLWLLLPRAMEAAAMPYRPADAVTRELTGQEAITLRYDLMYLTHCLDHHQLPDAPALRIREIAPAPMPPTQAKLWTEQPTRPTLY